MSVSYEPRTQKAIGLLALRNYYRVPPFTVIPIEKAAYYKKKMIGRFVRPCPITPRHGFVDSRLIRTREEAEAIIRETRLADPQAELMLSEPIEAEYNTIWTPGLLVIGVGNDGATAGHESLSLPVVGNLVSPILCKNAHITDAPFAELVYARGGGVYWTQLRNGPAVLGASDFIPETLEVKQVVEAEGDLLEWESRVRALGPGTVIYHPGGSLASHYAVHAILNKVPVLTSRRPEIGEVLEANANPSRSPDRNKLLEGFMIGVDAKVSMDVATKVMLVACHHAGVWAGVQDRLLGVGMGVAWRLTVTAALGEYRHAASQVKKHGSKPGRNQVYDRVYNKALANRWEFFNAMRSFSHEGWSSAFGGMKWYRFSRQGMVMFNHLLAGRTSQSLEAYNVLINMAHNGGWAFNKFLSANVMDQCAANPASLAIEVAPSLYKASRVEVPERVRKIFPKAPGVPRWFKGFEASIAEKEKTAEAKAKKEQEELKAAKEKAFATPSYPVAPVKLEGKPVAIQAKVVGVEKKKDGFYVNLHLQYKLQPGEAYKTQNVSMEVESEEWWMEKAESLSFRRPSFYNAKNLYYNACVPMVEGGHAWFLVNKGGSMLVGPVAVYEEEGNE